MSAFGHTGGAPVLNELLQSLQQARTLADEALSMTSAAPMQDIYNTSQNPRLGYTTHTEGASRSTFSNRQSTATPQPEAGFEDQASFTSDGHVSNRTFYSTNKRGRPDLQSGKNNQANSHRHPQARRSSQSSDQGIGNRPGSRGGDGIEAKPKKSKFPPGPRPKAPVAVPDFGFRLPPVAKPDLPKAEPKPKKQKVEKNLGLVPQYDSDGASDVDNEAQLAQAKDN